MQETLRILWRVKVESRLLSSDITVLTILILSMVPKAVSPDLLEKRVVLVSHWIVLAAVH